MATKKRKLNGKTKAAILMITIGPERSASLFSHMHEDEIESLTLEIASMQRIQPEEKDAVLEEFYEICVAQEYIAEGGINYAKEVLEKAMGSHKALEIINKLTSSLQVKPFDFVKKTDASQLISFIQNEHPQTLALILSYLNPNQAAQVLSALPQNKQADVAARIALMGSTSPEIIKEVENVLEKKLSSLVTQDYSLTGGIQSIVDILNSVDRGTEKYILETLEIQNAELVEEIRKKMFVFEDIVHLEGVAIQRFIREIDNNDLAIALKTATDELKDMIFANMSSRMREMLQEDMDFMGPVRLRDVEDAQQKIVNVIRKLEEANEIVISRGGGDELVV